MSKYKEKCEKFLEDLPKMDKKFQESTLKRYRGVTRVFLLQYGNDIEEYMEKRKKDRIYIDYYDVCKVLGVEPEDIRIDCMKKHYDRLASMENVKQD